MNVQKENKKPRGRQPGWRAANPKSVRLPGFRVTEDIAAWLKSEMKKTGDYGKPLNLGELLRRIILDAKERQENERK